MKNIYLIDGTGFIFRSYFAIRNMTNNKGLSTNAIFGFIRSLLKLQKDFSPEHLAVIFDGPNNSQSRKEIYADYKANRSAAPEDLPHQIQWAQDFCEKAGIPMLCVPGVEADDTIGSIALWAEKNHAKVFICSSDKDLCQLVNDNIHVLNVHKGNLILDSKKVEETFGVRPQQIVDYLAITGDQSDNVPGLNGFGPKTAKQLLKEFKTLDAILSHPEGVSGKKKQETLRDHADIALLSRQLVTLNTEVPFPMEKSFFSIKDTDITGLRTFYQDKNFNSLFSIAA